MQTRQRVRDTSTRVIVAVFGRRQMFQNGLDYLLSNSIMGGQYRKGTRLGIGRVFCVDISVETVMSIEGSFGGLVGCGKAVWGFIMIMREGRSVD